MNRVKRLIELVAILGLIGAAVRWGPRLLEKLVIGRPAAPEITQEAGIGKPTVFPNAVLRGRVVEGESGLELDPIVNRQATGANPDIATYPLTGAGVQAQKLFRKNADRAVTPVGLSDIGVDDQIYVGFYRRPGEVRGIIEKITAAAITFAGDPVQREYPLSSAEFNFEDPSGFFWKPERGIANLKPGDSVVIEPDESGNARKVTYRAPLLGAAADDIRVLARRPGEVVILVGNITEVVVDEKTQRGIFNSPQEKVPLDRITDGWHVWVQYYNDGQSLRAISLTLGVPY